LEAAAAGVAIVATDAGGTREIFPQRSEAACLVPPDDAQALAAAIARLLGDAAERRRLAENARRRAEQAFDLPQAIDGLLGHYEELSGCP
jgi:glycosyltransferase involved in cell wall biosynthesis